MIKVANKTSKWCTATWNRKEWVVMRCGEWNHFSHVPELRVMIQQSVTMKHDDEMLSWHVKQSTTASRDIIDHCVEEAMDNNVRFCFLYPIQKLYCRNGQIQYWYFIIELTKIHNGLFLASLWIIQVCYNCVLIIEAKKMLSLELGSRLCFS